jgi:hypothetical protein
METIPFYRIRQLIIKKYGEKNFHTACDMVAQFIGYEAKLPLSSGHIRLMCEVTESDLISENRPIAVALKSLFHLESLAELFTLPENTPENFLT